MLEMFEKITIFRLLFLILSLEMYVTVKNFVTRTCFMSIRTGGIRVGGAPGRL